MDLLKKFEEYIRKESLFTKGDPLLLAVSGGVDSIVLCELCYRAGFNFTIAHCNFQLREQESNEDEKLVSDIAATYGKLFLSKKFNTAAYMNQQGKSVQEAARELRYAWFTELLKENNINVLLTAHHANDNIETLLMNFFKGTGISGLHGILPKSGEAFKVVRPLLFAKKAELINFAEQAGLRWREDVSNASDKYTRNYFRNQIIPSIEKVFPAAEENLLFNIERFRDIGQLASIAEERFSGKLIHRSGNEIHIPVLGLQKTPGYKTVLFGIISKYGFKASQLNEIIKLLHADSGKYIDSATHRVLKNRKFIIIAPRKKVDNSLIIIEKEQPVIEFAGGILNIETSQSSMDFNNNNNATAILDSRDITYPLLLRKWKKGDYFYPLGMQKKKKLSRFFIDQKLSLIEKENCWIIESNRRIIWILGMRIDDRFKITSSTKESIKIDWTSAK